MKKKDFLTFKEDNMEAWYGLAKNNEIPMRVYLSIFYHVFEESLKTGTWFPKPNENCGLLTADRIKLFADGALGASTAALTVNYKGLTIKNFNPYAVVSFMTFLNFSLKS